MSKLSPMFEAIASHGASWMPISLAFARRVLVAPYGCHWSFVQEVSLCYPGSMVLFGFGRSLAAC
jgi:hypothetical protein